VDSLRQGAIAWVKLKDPRGGKKTRPVVVVTGDPEIQAGGKIHGVAVTSRVDGREDEVELPWHRSRHPYTGLSKPSVAVCSWVVDFMADQVEVIEGMVPRDRLINILEQLRRLGN